MGPQRACLKDAAAASFCNVFGPVTRCRVLDRVFVFSICAPRLRRRIDVRLGRPCSRIHGPYGILRDGRQGPGECELAFATRAHHNPAPHVPEELAQALAHASAHPLHTFPVAYAAQIILATDSYKVSHYRQCTSPPPLRLPCPRPRSSAAHHRISLELQQLPLSCGLMMPRSCPLSNSSSRVVATQIRPARNMSTPTSSRAAASSTRSASLACSTLSRGTSPGRSSPAR